eukprot:4557034-Heterocapsa_arctica.AAC.1
MPLSPKNCFATTLGFEREDHVELGGVLARTSSSLRMQFRGQRREQVKDLVELIVAAGRAAAATLLSGAAFRVQADYRQRLRVLAELTPS